MDLSAIFSDFELPVLRALEQLYFEEVTFRTSEHFVQLTWEGHDTRPVWRVEAHLPEAKA